MQPDEYPSENEIISSQNSNNTPQENYCPPPVSQNFYQPTEPGINQNPNPQPNNIYQVPNPQPGGIYQNPNPQPQAPYMKPSPPPMNPPSAVPPPIQVGNDVSYQPMHYNNQNAMAIPVQPQPQYVAQQPVVIQPVVQPVVKVQQTNVRDYDYERRRRQQQDEEDCMACCQVLCICLYCFALLAGGR